MANTERFCEPSCPGCDMSKDVRDTERKIEPAKKELVSSSYTTLSLRDDDIRLLIQALVQLSANDRNVQFDCPVGSNNWNRFKDRAEEALLLIAVLEMNLS